MEHILRGGPLEKGDKIIVGYTDSWCTEDDIVTVEYLVPSYGKIICRNGDHTLCLYYCEENYRWKRV